MCFYIHKDYPNELIAKRDIECFKILATYPGVPETYSLFFDAIYFKKGGSSEYVTKQVKRFTFETIDCDTINEGLHSYSTFIQAKNKKTSGKIYKCIIPKGTKYYYNPVKKEYVSLKLKAYRKPIIY